MNTQDSQTNKDAKNAIEYPILWEYLIFCTDKESLKSTIEAKFGGLEYSFADEIECVKFVL